MFIKEKEVTIFGRIFPMTKTDKDRGIKRKKVIFFISAAKFAANMTSEFEVIKSFNKTHTIAKQFDNSSILLKLIRGFRDLSGSPRIN